jgi:hypothetical protein
MFCPKCATQNADGASFCRACGANIGLVPQALSGQLPTAPAPVDLDLRLGRRRRRNRDDGPPSLEKGIVNVFMGLGFLIAALAVIFRFPGGFTWGWAFFIPGFSCLGKGIASIVAAGRSKPPVLPPASLGGPNAFLPGVPQSFAPPASIGTRKLNTSELRPSVPSVTEGTTRHLGAEASTQHFETVTGEERMP